MEVGNKQGYTGVEHKKDKLVDERDGGDKGEEEIEGRNDIFIGVKQVNLHASMVGFEDTVFFGIHRRR